MSLTFWNRRRREAAEAGELRDSEAVAEAAEATAGQGGTEGAEGHTGTTLTDPPLGAPDSSGIDTGGATHEDASQEAEGAAQGPETQVVVVTSEGVETHETPQEPASGAENASEGGDTQADENGAEDGAGDVQEGAEAPTDDPQPGKSASKDAWTAYALGHGKTEEDLAGLTRDGIRDLFA